MTELELELRANKLSIIALLAEQMVAMKFNEYKDYRIEEDKPIAYLDATIDILKKAVKQAKLGEAKLVKFDKLAADRANLTPEELKQLAIDQERNNEIVDSYLATLDPRASLKGKLYAPNSVIMRYRGNIGSEFSKNYPFGVLL
jgi:hypothetical protein